MYTKKDILFFALIIAGFICAMVGLFVLNSSADSTEEIKTKVKGYECITKIHYENHLFGEDHQHFKTYCLKSGHHY